MQDNLMLDAKALGLPIDNAAHLRDRYEHLVDAMAANNAASMCDHAKTLLETVFRTIITNRNGSITETPAARASFVELYRQAIACVTIHDSDDDFLPIVKKAVQIIATMRDNYGASSHGQDGYHERRLELAEAMFVARLSLTAAGYMYERHIHTSTDNQDSRIHYENNQAFNDLLDSEGDIEVAGIFVSPSKILFEHDPIAYREQLIEFENDAEIESAAESWFERQAEIARGR